MRHCGGSSAHAAMPGRAVGPLLALEGAREAAVALSPAPHQPCDSTVRSLEVNKPKPTWSRRACWPAPRPRACSGPSTQPPGLRARRERDAWWRSLRPRTFESATRRARAAAAGESTAATAAGAGSEPLRAPGLDTPADAPHRRRASERSTTGRRRPLAGTCLHLACGSSPNHWAVRPSSSRQQAANRPAARGDRPPGPTNRRRAPFFCLQALSRGAAPAVRHAPPLGAHAARHDVHRG